MLDKFYNVKYILSSIYLMFAAIKGFPQALPVDKNATIETRKLFLNLRKVAKSGVLFGHQNDLAYGVGSDKQFGRSNIKKLSGSYPSVFGWDLGWLEVGKKRSVEHISFDSISMFIKYVYSEGGINTVAWHFNNPVDPSQIYRTNKLVDSTIKKLFSDSTSLIRYMTWLDTLAKFFKSLKGKNGELIPLIFRPFHENNGNWFWWGRGQCSPKEYIRLWTFTVNYLRDIKQVHNLLYAYSTDRFELEEQYLERYPGDNYVDILGFDFYDNPKLDNDSINTFTPKALNMVRILKDLSTRKSKLSAFTETGYLNMPIKNWWTSRLVPIIENSGLSYVMLWSYYSFDHYFDTYPGQKSADDFGKLSNDRQILFLKRFPGQMLYK